MTGSRGVWRHRLSGVALCAGLLLGQPAAADSQVVGGQVSVAQLDPSFRQPICQLVVSLQAAFAGFPGVTAIFTSLLQSFGCPGGPTSGTTTTVAPGTTTTVAPPTTVPGTSSTTVSTTPTTLPPCTPTTTTPATTVPCVPA